MTMDIFHQIGNFFLQALPTVVIIFFFYLFMRWAFFTPIQKAMAERSAKIEGARAEAAQVESAAKQDLQRYNEELNKARAHIYQEQEASRQLVLDERSKLLKAMRSRAQEDIAAAKKTLEAELAAAAADADVLTPGLAGEIARQILSRSSASSEGNRR
ncbi:MAG: ATP synthase F0 subunit B [Candidatus Acidiferrales bacterium]